MNFFLTYIKEMSKKTCIRFNLRTSFGIRHRILTWEIFLKESHLFLVAVKKNDLEILESVSSLVYTSNEAMI